MSEQESADLPAVSPEPDPKSQQEKPEDPPVGVVVYPRTVQVAHGTDVREQPMEEQDQTVCHPGIRKK